MIKKFFAALTVFCIVSLTGCAPVIDDTVYWPDSLVYKSNITGNLVTGHWNTNPDGTGSYLLFENDKLFRKAKLSVSDEDNGVRVTTDYELVSYDAYSFIVRKGNTEYTVHYLVIGDSITITGSNGIINHLIYFKIED